jgi:sirohydrochlorin ferrochelatase
MATWDDLVEFIRQEYEIVREEPDEIRLSLEFGGDSDDEERSQMVVVAREVLEGREEWVQIATPFALVSEVDLKAVLEEIASSVFVGGAAIMGDYLVLRHTLPLVNLDINEFVDPLELVTGSAELLEIRFSGRDDF